MFTSIYEDLRTVLFFFLKVLMITFITIAKSIIDYTL